MRWENEFYNSCYQSQNYKIWKQFTTPAGGVRGEVTVVINRKTTKFESNSQPILLFTSGNSSCYQSQNYKIWKQFTTKCYLLWVHLMLLSIAKLQNLKAIHNYRKGARSFNPVVINRKTTKFESNSQPLHPSGLFFFCCYQSQNYKIWKQFTTKSRYTTNGILLLSIAKLQNLKAIHN